MKKQKHPPFPSRLLLSNQDILDAIENLSDEDKGHAESFIEDIGMADFRKVLNSMSRWYWNSKVAAASARELIKHRSMMMKIMDLRPEAALGTYRGIRVPNDTQLANCQPGDIVTISPAKDKHVYSSWTEHKNIATHFIRAPKGETGILVKIADTKGIKPFLAPPSFTEDWFNNLYSQDTKKDVRYKEGEFAIYAKKIKVEVVATKRKKR